MDKIYKLLKVTIWILVIAVVIAGAYVGYGYLKDRVQMETLATQPAATGESGEEAESQDPPAPDFTGYDLGGKPHKLSDFEGKPVVLNFWASWCGPCKSEMPDFEAAYKQYGEEIHFLMVNLTDGAQETVATASAFITGQGYTFPVYYDTAYSAAMTYGITAVPVTYFIDAQGYLVAHGQGALSGETLQKGINMIYNPG